MATFGTKLHYLHNKKTKHSVPEASYFIIRIPNFEICYYLFILALIMASFPLTSSTSVLPQQDSTNMDQLLTNLFRDLTNEGLMKKTEQHKAVFLAKEEEEKRFQVFTDYNMNHILSQDLEKQNSVPDETIDFIFTYNFPASSQFIERVLKNGGVAVVVLNDNPSSAFYKPSNYKIAYMRRFNLMAMAMKKKNRATNEPKHFITQRKLCGYATEAKKAALQNLEDVLLEPPRAASGKSRVYLKRTRYLPDLMGDSLESYPRRVFIDVGLPEKDGGSGTDWFPKNYPTRNKNFEMYKIETVTEGSSEPQIEMSDWLRKNVKEEEYVVMKAEAEVVEEMMRSKAIMLVDELFLECKPHKQGNKKNRRAYWECLALYGKLRDEGVAVHQWWG
ncbi:hypothetical protein SESBI_17331 [Sesbania bispinosa]|nr:hypothetical protein SESBI_17331 [Sesbania bispinosa]